MSVEILSFIGVYLQGCSVGIHKQHRPSQSCFEVICARQSAGESHAGEFCSEWESRPSGFMTASLFHGERELTRHLHVKLAVGETALFRLLSLLLAVCSVSRRVLTVSNQFSMPADCLVAVSNCQTLFKGVTSRIV